MVAVVAAAAFQAARQALSAAAFVSALPTHFFDAADAADAAADFPHGDDDFGAAARSVIPGDGGAAFGAAFGAAG